MAETIRKSLQWLSRSAALSSWKKLCKSRVKFCKGCFRNRVNSWQLRIVTHNSSYNQRLTHLLFIQRCLVSLTHNRELLFFLSKFFLRILQIVHSAVVPGFLLTRKYNSVTVGRLTIKIMRMGNLFSEQVDFERVFQTHLHSQVCFQRQNFFVYSVEVCHGCSPWTQASNVAANSPRHVNVIIRSIKVRLHQFNNLAKNV